MSRRSGGLDLRWVYQETKHKCRGEEVPKSTKYQISTLGQVVPPGIPGPYPLSVKVHNMDCLELARNLKLTDPTRKVLVLNMASDFKPGGGVESGRMAQEEEIFRRSNAFLTHPACWYKLVDRAIYSPEVTILRDSEYDWYKRGEQVQVSMVAVAALRKPRLVRGGYTPEDRLEMKRRIEAIFQIALKEGQDVLVLGALGAGCFLNPPGEVAELFQEAHEKYGTYFREIHFAVLVVKGKDQENYDTFLSLATN